MPNEQIVVMKATRVRGPRGRVITLTPGLKSREVSEHIKSTLPQWRETMGRLKAKGRVVEATPPW